MIPTPVNEAYNGNDTNMRPLFVTDALTINGNNYYNSPTPGAFFGSFKKSMRQAANISFSFLLTMRSRSNNGAHFLHEVPWRDSFTNSKLLCKTPPQKKFITR